MILNRYRSLQLVVLTLVVSSLWSCNKTEDAIENVSSEIQYQVVDIVEGTGVAAEPGKLLDMNFAIYMIPDTATGLTNRWEGDTAYKEYLVINSKHSPENNRPALYDGNSLFPGLYDGLEGMKEGGIRIIVCPSERAFGETGNGEVPPNTPIKVEVELASVDTIRDITPVDWSKAERSNDGLQWVILDEGSGPRVKEGYGIIFNAIGKVVETGETFDNTWVTGKPQRMVVGDVANPVFPGIVDAVLKLRVGGRGRFLMPSNLTYGNKPPNEFFPPNGTLEFEIEIVSMSDDVIDIPGDNAL